MILNSFRFKLSQKLYSTIFLGALLLTGCGSGKAPNCDSKSLTPEYSNHGYYYSYETLESKVRRIQCAADPAAYLEILPAPANQNTYNGGYYYSTYTNPEAPTAEQIVLQTQDRFFELNPNMEQVAQLLQRISGVTHQKIEATMAVKRSAFEYGRSTHRGRAPIVSTPAQYSRLMRNFLPAGTAPTPEFLNAHQAVFFETFLPFRDQSRFTLEDLNALPAILENFPLEGLWLNQPADEARQDILIGIQEQRDARIEQIRTTAVENLTRSVRQLLEERPEVRDEDEGFKYYLIGPAPQPRTHVHDRACHLYCGEGFDENHRGVHCLSDGCTHSIHSRHSSTQGDESVGSVELLDHVLNSMARLGGTRPVTCDGSENGHELYLPDPVWAEMREGLNHQIQTLTAEVRTARQNPNQPPAQLEQDLANLQRAIDADDEVITNLRGQLAEIVPAALRVHWDYYLRTTSLPSGITPEARDRLNRLVDDYTYAYRGNGNLRRISDDIRGRERNNQARRQQLMPLQKFSELIKRQRQLQNWNHTHVSWKLQTLWAYYRHLRGLDERQLQNAPFRACNRDYCRNLVHREQRNEQGNYLCEGCNETRCYDCDHAAHAGQTCQEYQDALAGDRAFQVLLHDPNSNVRPCPRCLSPIQRNTGCDGVTCTARLGTDASGQTVRCNTNFNWVHGLPPAAGQAVPHTFLPEGTPRTYRVEGDENPNQTQAYHDFWAGRR